MHDWCYTTTTCMGLQYDLPYFVGFKWKCNGGAPYCSKREKKTKFMLLFPNYEVFMKFGGNKQESGLQVCTVQLDLDVLFSEPSVPHQFGSPVSLVLVSYLMIMIVLDRQRWPLPLALPT